MHSIVIYTETPRETAVMDEAAASVRLWHKSLRAEYCGFDAALDIVTERNLAKNERSGFI